MRLNPAHFNAHLAHMGQQFTLRTAQKCPCKAANSGAADQHCQICTGRGVFWGAAVAGIAGMASQKTQQQWAQFGQWMQGDTVLTIPENSPLYDMGDMDRVVALNATNQFSQTLVRGSDDRLKFPVKSVDRVFWLNTGHTAIVEGSLPAVASDGALSWSSGAPPSTYQYTVSGVRYLEYFCYMDFPSNRGMHMGARLPRRVVLRAFDLFGR